MAEFIHVVQGDFEAFADAIDSVGDDLARLDIEGNMTSIHSTMPGARSLSAWRAALDAVAHRIDLRERECRDLSAHALQARANYSHSDTAVSHDLDHLASGDTVQSTPAASPAFFDADRLRMRLGG
ncbi:hypothetical protein [Schaalia sp. Marseille-Q2122]|uniref:hypothetical protein n=1 Tax=Schaalia sp. Marseille-Q2122 TaxID=2736604 RepID=UPI0015885BCE|nr:hypothetical protein [Schaalia sp. Marseille-Q2122]